MAVALVVTGLFGIGGKSEKNMKSDLEAKGYTVVTRPWWAPDVDKIANASNTKLVVGHSMGGLRVAITKTNAKKVLINPAIPNADLVVNWMQDTSLIQNKFDWLSVFVTGSDPNTNEYGHTYRSGL